MRYTLLISGAALALACSRVPESAPEKPAAEAPKAPAQEVSMVEHSPFQVPFTLTLLPAAESAEGLRVELTAVIDAPKATSVPIELSVTLPEDARLVSGPEKESLSLPSGKTMRKWVVEAKSKLDARHPIKISADQKGPDGAWGAHAERAYPAEAVALRRSPAVPPPPVSRPPVPYQARPVLPNRQ